MTTKHLELPKGYRAVITGKRGEGFTYALTGPRGATRKLGFRLVSIKACIDWATRDARDAKRRAQLVKEKA